MKNINCIHADNPFGLCKNKNIKRFFLIGPRNCIVYDNPSCSCHEKEEFKRPIPNTKTWFNVNKAKNVIMRNKNNPLNKDSLRGLYEKQTGHMWFEDGSPSYVDWLECLILSRSIYDNSDNSVLIERDN